jgi:hypothetical protein
MKRLVLAIALFASTPAAAAPPPEWATLTAREARASQHIDAAQKDGRITGAEAERLRRQVHKVESLRLYYRKSHGMSAWERRDLERRLKAIEARLARAKGKTRA